MIEFIKKYKLVILWALLAFILDIIGYYKLYQNKISFLNALYLSLGLLQFNIQLPSIDAKIPWELEMGRWLTGGLTFYAIFKVVAKFLHKKIKITSKGNNHIVIIGTGEKGKILAKSWLEKTKDKNHKDYKKLIVFIEKDKNNPNANLLEDLGCVVVYGNAKDKEVLKEANINKASYIVTLTNSDLTNIEILGTCLNNNLLKKDAKVYIHLSNNEYYEIFNAEMLNHKEVEIKSFNIYSNAIRLLMKEKPLGADIFTDECKIKDKDIQIKIALIGRGIITENILYYILNIAHFYNENLVTIDIVYDKNINNNFEDELNAKYHIQEYNGKYWNVNIIDDKEFFEKNESDYNYIFLSDENENIRFSNLMKTLRNLSKAIHNNNTKIYFYADGLENISSILKEDKEFFGKVIPFGNISQTCSYEAIIDEILDKKAMLNNKFYSDLHGYNKDNLSKEELWKRLNIFLKDSNRFAVEHNLIKEYLIENLIKGRKPLHHYEDIKNIIKKDFYKYNGDKINWDKLIENSKGEIKYKLEKLSIDEIEQLAKIEHTRWCAFHVLNGWRKFEIPENKKEKIKKDPTLKLHPCIVSWEELDKVSKNHQHNYKLDDIETILRIPSLNKLEEKDNK